MEAVDVTDQMLTAKLVEGKRKKVLSDLQMRISSEEFEKFTTEGFFTVRRSDKLWAGTWSDMIIEQFLICSMKTSGGLTRGQGLTDSVLSRH